jgi:hypothetical protein
VLQCAASTVQRVKSPRWHRHKHTAVSPYVVSCVFFCPGRSDGQRGDTAVRRRRAAGYVGRHRAHRRRRAAARPARAPGAGDNPLCENVLWGHLMRCVPSMRKHACMRGGAACTRMYTHVRPKAVSAHWQAAGGLALAASLHAVGTACVTTRATAAGVLSLSIVQHLLSTTKRFVTVHIGLGRACATSVTTEGGVSSQQHRAPLRCLDR